MTGNVGKNIKRRLDILGKNASELADHAGVSKCHISRLIAGERDVGKISIGTAIRVADFLGISVYELISPPTEDVASGSAKYGLH